MPRGGKREGAGRKKAPGAPSPYDPSFCKDANKLCILGATDVEIADFFDISVMTLYRWKAKHPDFCEALKTGKDKADERVERSLYHRAVGYSFDAEKIAINSSGDITRAKYREHVPPDTTAMIFWLKNRRSADWRDKTEVYHKHDVSSLTDDELERIAAGGGERAALPAPEPSKLN